MNLAERRAHYAQQEADAQRDAQTAPKRHCGFFHDHRKEFVFVSSILYTKQDIDWQITALMAMRSCLPDEAPSPTIAGAGVEGAGFADGPVHNNGTKVP